jgi:tRNA U55 pseudouridine synthase TruB
MSALTRTECSGFTLAEAHTLSEFEAMSEDELEACILPTEYIFREYRKIRLPEFFARLAKSGLEIYLKKINEQGECGEHVALYDAEGEFFAVGEVREFEAELAVKPIRQLS